MSEERVKVIDRIEKLLTAFQDEASRHGGELVPAGGDVAAAIRRVGERIGATDALVDSCISDLPAEDLS